MSEAPIEIAKKIIRGESRTPILITEAKENSSTLMKKVNLIALTEDNLSIFNSSNGKTKCSFPWIHLKKVEIANDGIKFTFLKKKFSVETKQSNALIGALGYILRQVMPSYPLQECGLKKFHFPKVKNSNYGAFVRFLSIINENKIVMPPTTYSAIESLIRFSPKTFDLATIPELRRFSSIIISILPLLTDIVHISVPIEETLNAFADHPDCFCKVSSIEFVGQKHPQFIQFLEKFQSLPKKKLKAAVFTNTELSTQEIPSLVNFISKTELSSLGIHNAFEHDSQLSLYKNILVPSITQKLTILNLDNSRTIDLQKLIPLISNVTLLSLASCNLQVGEALKALSLSNLPNLRFLNLSGNISASQPPEGCTIPRQLYYLMLNDIKWQATTLLDMLKLIFAKGPEQFILSMSHALAPFDTWPQVFDLFGSTDYRSLTGFTWDGNPIHKNLFVFLHANSFLDYLSMNECFHHEIKESVADLANFIDSTSRLKFLSIRGSNKNHIGCQCGPLFRAIANSPSIVHFDITGNQIGDPGISAFRTLLMNNKVLQLIAIDGSQPEDSMLFLEAMDVASQNRNRIQISFPLEDVIYLMGKDRISQEQKMKLLQSFQKTPTLKNGKSQCMFTTPSQPNSPFLQPFNVFLYKPREQFPYVMSPERIEEIKNPPKLPPLPPRPVMQRRAASVKRPMRMVQKPVSANPQLSPVSQRFASLTPVRSATKQTSNSPPPEPHVIPFFLQKLYDNIQTIGFDSDTSSYYSNEYSDGPEVIITKAQPKVGFKEQRSSRRDKNADNGPQVDFGQSSQRRHHSNQQQQQVEQEQPRRKHHREAPQEPQPQQQQQDQQSTSGRRKHHREAPQEPVVIQQQPQQDQLSTSGRRKHKREEAPQQIQPQNNTQEEQRTHHRKHSAEPIEQQPQQRRSQSVSGSRRKSSAQQPEQQQSQNQNQNVEDQPKRRKQTSQQQQPIEENPPVRRHHAKSNVGDKQELLNRERDIQQAFADDTTQRRKKVRATSQVGDRNEINQRNEKMDIQPENQQEERTHRRKKISVAEPPQQQQANDQQQIRRKKLSVAEQKTQEQQPLDEQVQHSRRKKSSDANQNSTQAEAQQQQNVNNDQPMRRKKVRSTSVVQQENEILERNRREEIPQEEPQRRKKVRAPSTSGNANEIRERNEQAEISQQQNTEKRRKVRSNQTEPETPNQPQKEAVQIDELYGRRKKRAQSVAPDKNEIIDRNKAAALTPQKPQQPMTPHQSTQNTQQQQPQQSRQPNDLLSRRKKRYQEQGTTEEAAQPQQQQQQQQSLPTRRRRTSNAVTPNVAVPVVAPLVKVPLNETDTQKSQQRQPQQQQQQQPTLRRRRNQGSTQGNSVFNIGAPVQQHNPSTTVPAAAFMDSDGI